MVQTSCAVVNNKFQLVLVAENNFLPILDGFLDVLMTMFLGILISAKKGNIVTFGSVSVAYTSTNASLVTYNTDHDVLTGFRRRLPKSITHWW